MSNNAKWTLDRPEDLLRSPRVCIDNPGATPRAFLEFRGCTGLSAARCIHLLIPVASGPERTLVESYSRAGDDATAALQGT